MLRAELHRLYSPHSSKKFQVIVGDETFLECLLGLLVHPTLILQKDDCDLESAFEAHRQRVDNLENFISVRKGLQGPKLAHAIVDESTRNMKFAIQGKISPELFLIHLVHADSCWAERPNSPTPGRGCPP